MDPLKKKRKRLKKFFSKDGKTVLLVFDHAVEHGPHNYEGVDLTPLRIAEIAVSGGAKGVILHAGSAKLVKQFYPELPVIVKITGRTSLTPTMVQEIVTTVEEAERVGADGIAMTVYVGATYEHKMLRNLAEVKKECYERGLPLFTFMYPRVKDKKTTEEKYVRYAARLGAELGVDVVKTYYTGDKKSFSKVVKDCFVPLVCAGGLKTKTVEDFLKKVETVMEAGASGLAVGRNVWMRENPIEVLKQVVKRVIKGE
ncbi:MAG: fructose-bisphosphate aldolase [Candidatus Aenigmarchaeota archaeon]|nr:fructose-bisphosphate aldolase [Candidatus Aenigmarchaeota archaeon]